MAKMRAKRVSDGLQAKTAGSSGRLWIALVRASEGRQNRRIVERVAAEEPLVVEALGLKVAESAGHCQAA